MASTKRQELSVVERLCSGAIAGAVGKSAVAPFQRVQIMFQVDKSKKPTLGGFFTLSKDIVKNEGILYLWRGNLANAVRSGPTAAIKFFTQSAYKNMLNEKTSMGRGPKQFLSGAMSGITTVCLTYPLDLFRTKMAASSEFSSYADCTRKTFAASGLRGFYHGIQAPVVGSIPHTGIAFWAFQWIKDQMGLDDDARTKAPIRRTIAGFLAGLAGQTVTYPFSTIRRRMQTSLEWNSKGLIGTGVEMLRKEGFVVGWYRAYSIHAFKGPVSAGISFMMFDILRGYLYDYHRKE